jgi:hypothetical protein
MQCRENPLADAVPLGQDGNIDGVPFLDLAQESGLEFDLSGDAVHGLEQDGGLAVGPGLLQDLQAGSVDGFELSHGVDSLLGIPGFEGAMLAGEIHGMGRLDSPGIWL